MNRQIGGDGDGGPGAGLHQGVAHRGEDRGGSGLVKSTFERAAADLGKILEHLRSRRWCSMGTSRREGEDQGELEIVARV